MPEAGREDWKASYESLSREVRLWVAPHPNHPSPLGCPGQAPQEIPRL